MSTKKFTELSNYPSGSVNAATDILAIVDIASDESKKITVQDLGGVIGGGGTPTGSFMITGSVTDNTLTFTKGDGSTFLLTVDTGSSGAGTLQQVTDLGNTTTQPITSSALRINNGVDISPDLNGSGQFKLNGNAYTGYIAMDGTAMYLGHNSSGRNFVLQTDDTDRLTIDGPTGNISASGDLSARDGRFSRGAGVEIEIIGSTPTVGGVIGTQTNHNLLLRRNNIEKLRIEEPRTYSSQPLTVTGSILVSGSTAHNPHINVMGNISASGYISASSFNSTPGITNQLTSSYAITASYALNGGSGGSAAGTNGMVQLSDGAGGFKTSTNSQFYYDNTGGFVVGDGFDLYFISQSIAGGQYLTLGDATNENGENKIRIPNGATSDPIEITGSLSTSGSVDINLPSGSAFIIRETDLASNSDDRLVFGYDNGDPSLTIISDGSGVASIRLQDEETQPTSGLTLNQIGQFRIGDDNGFKMTNDSATEFDISPIAGSPSANTNDLGNNSRPWSNLYVYNGVGYSSGGVNFNTKRLNITGENRATGFFNYGMMSFQYSGSSADTLENPVNHFFGMRVGDNYGSSINERLMFSVGKSGSLGININQGKVGLGGSTFTFHTASAMVHAEAEPNYDLNLFQGNDVDGNNVFEVDRTGNITTTGSLNVSGTGSIAYLEPTETFVNYITFCHNFVPSSTNDFYLPWSDSSESTTTNTKAAFQVPYSMSLHKIMFSVENVAGGGQDVIFELVEEANSTGTITSLATSSVTSLTEPGDDRTAFTLSASDFNNQPIFTYPSKARIIISSSINFNASSNDIFVTTIWRQEMKL